MSLKPKNGEQPFTHAEIEQISNVAQQMKVSVDHAAAMVRAVRDAAQTQEPEVEKSKS